MGRRPARNADNRCTVQRNKSPGAPGPAAGLQGQSSPDSPAARGALARYRASSRPPPQRRARCLPSAQGAAGGLRGAGAGAGVSYLAQQPSARPAAARPAAAAAAGASRGDEAGAFLLSRRRRRRLSGGAQNIHGLSPGSRPPRPGRSRSQDAWGVCKALCPSNLLSRLRRAVCGPRERDPSPVLRLQPRLGQPLSPELSGSLSPTAKSPPLRLEKSVPCARGGRPGAPSVEAVAAPPALRAPSLAQLVTFHQLSSPAPQPRPMADAGSGQRPLSALCCHLLTPAPSLTSQKVEIPAAPPSLPPSPPPQGSTPPVDQDARDPQDHLTKMGKPSLRESCPGSEAIPCLHDSGDSDF
ncbi:Hypothetical predicted protein [Marmota monax]|uniref:Uncharacterized protein n=1 Tax=Marmota monax TaxID=9995 RepID=A0A5E4AMN7_MARMO|nr:hypothetical protein GHT09_008213 [Marmota monax]VTJ57939.1 Hypothetical predicted protein [Marmota monax]